jgi:hypothetical protein
MEMIMPAPATLSSVDAIVAAEHELKRRRLGEDPALDAAEKAGRKTQKKVLCRVRLTKSEYRELARLKKRLARHGVTTSKKELVRAGLLLLVHIDRTDLKAAMRDVIAPEPKTKERP